MSSSQNTYLQHLIFSFFSTQTYSRNAHAPPKHGVWFIQIALKACNCRHSRGPVLEPHNCPHFSDPFFIFSTQAHSRNAHAPFYRSGSAVGPMICRGGSAHSGAGPMFYRSGSASGPMHYRGGSTQRRAGPMFYRSGSAAGPAGPIFCGTRSPTPFGFYKIKSQKGRLQGMGCAGVGALQGMW